MLTLLLALTLAFIWGNSLLSRETSGMLSDTLMEKLNAAAAFLGLPEDLFTVMADTDDDGIEEESSYLIRKAAHVTEFAVLSALLWLRLGPESPRRGRLTLGLCAAVAAADETIQIFSRRGPSVIDVGIDCCGAALGWLLVSRVFRRPQA